MRDLLKRAVQALTQPADVQLALFPDCVCKGDELALDFDDGLYEMVGHEHEYTPDQHSAISQLAARFSAMSGEQNAHLWTDDAIRSHLAWTEIRVLAEDVARICGWPAEPPGPSQAIYIRGG